MARYTARARSMLSPVAQLLSTDGIVQTEPLYEPEILQKLKAAMDPVFAVQEDKARSYFTVEDMVRLNLIDTILGGQMRDLILSIVPDPVLYHCHAYEIAANSTTSHIFSEALAGWHRDPDSEYFVEDPTHTSIFVYLTDVGPEDGAFEFSPSYPESWVRSKNPAISMMGPTGMSFAWNRAYYHRASPNRGPRRRRLLKLSIQRNAFPSAHLSNANFQAARKTLLPGDHPGSTFRALPR